MSLGETSTRYNEVGVPLSSAAAAAESAVTVAEVAGSIPAGGHLEPLLMEGLPPGSGQFDGRAEPVRRNSGQALSSVEAATVRGQLTEAEATDVLRAAGWPTELIPQALAVSWCESKWSPYASGDSGRSRGWFQLNVATWFPYAGEDPEQWADPLVNARVALKTYNYDLSKGYAPWTQWSCRSVLH